jgi:murein DD-endopeptidase MepM/ murein hydrolase activator NlpD
VSRPFAEPACPYCPGHRGVEYDTAVGDRVYASVDGVVTFSGVVVGARYVTVREAGGLLTTYGGLKSALVAAGARVTQGQTIGIAGQSLLFTIRDAPNSYLDPQEFVGTMRYRPRLVPVDGSAPRRSAPMCQR